MTSQPQQRPSTYPSLIEWYANTLERLCICGSQQEQVFETQDDTWSTANSSVTADQIQSQEQLQTYLASKNYSLLNQYRASTPLPTVEEPSICRNATLPIQNTTKTKTTTTSGRTVDSARLFASSLRVDGIINRFNEENGEPASSPRDLRQSPSSLLQCCLPQDEDSCDSLFVIQSFSKYPEDGPISPTDTESTVSLSDSRSMTTQDEEDEWFQEFQDNGTNNTAPTLLRMKPRNYFLQEKQLEGELRDDSQNYYSNTCGVTFQPRTKLPNRTMNGEKSLLTQPTQHTVQARTA